MGYNTSVTICNDNLGDYARQPEQLVRIIRQGIHRGAREWGVTVHQSDHADATQLIAVGGNTSTKLHTAHYAPPHHFTAGREELLRMWADALGYTLQRKK